MAANNRPSPIRSAPLPRIPAVAKAAAIRVKPMATPGVKAPSFKPITSKGAVLRTQPYKSPKAADIAKPVKPANAPAQHPHSNLGAYLHPAKAKNAKPVQSAPTAKSAKQQAIEAPPPNSTPANISTPLEWSGGEGQWGV